MDEKRLDSVIDQVSDNLFYVIREVGKRAFPRTKLMLTIFRRFFHGRSSRIWSLANCMRRILFPNGMNPIGNCSESW